MEYGWDTAKSEAVEAERGFGFAYAIRVFLGETVQVIDDRHDYGEVRVKAIGEIDGRVFTVVYTDRENLRWIITAWPSNRKERGLWRTR